MGSAKPPQSRIERYRERAKELREMAAKAKSPDTGDELLTLARQYEKLASDLSRVNKE